MVTPSGFQPSPYHTQPPAFSSPLDKIINDAQAGPSSRSQLLQRAFTLTRNSSVKRPNNGTAADQGSYFAGTIIDEEGSRNRLNGSNASNVPIHSTTQVHDRRIGAHSISEQQQRQQQQFSNARTNESRQEYGGAGTRLHSDPQSKARFAPLSQSSHFVNPSEQRRNVNNHVQNQRAARLSQQNTFLQRSSEQEQNSSNSSLSNAFRDSIASTISFNSITGSEDRSSMMFNNSSGDDSSSKDGDIHAGLDGFANDTDRIAREVRGLAMRRRPSMDTVRSSEFGEGGRWAQAWAGSDDGEDEEEDEMDLQAMRTRDMSNFDVESIGAQNHLGAGALGELGHLQGARAAMNGTQKGENSVQRQVLNPSQVQNMALPRIHDVTNAMHTVNLTLQQHKPSLQDHSRTNPSHPSRPQYLYTNTQSDLARRDTITSVSGEIGEVAESQQLVDHRRSDSNATVSTLQSNQHVKVWPPTPATSERKSSANQTRMNRSDTLRASPLTGQMAMGQSAKVEYASSPGQPVCPSTLLAQVDHTSPAAGALIDAMPNQSDNKPYTGYGDPNQHSFYAPPETFGKARQKAIADHDGRESMVSDLDVETLRLDGSSVAGESRDESSSRRDSTSTVGSMDTAILDEQRRRRSQMEQHEEMIAQNKRSSASTIRGQQSMYDQTQGYGSGLLKRNVSHPRPTVEKEDPFPRGPPPPRRSNTLPEEQAIPPTNQVLSPRSNYATPTLSPAPWAKNSPIQSPSMHPGSPSMQSTNLSTQSTLFSATSTALPSKRTSASNQIVQSEAEKFLTLGITHHESGDLSRSAFYFERSAKIEGGCVVGMCMWGMALREGWGVRKDQKRGFEWISRAASKAGDLMASKNSKTRNEAELKAVRSELKLSVYELGKCFCYGWGVKQDRQMALEYFELAAKLGDSDAQAEAGALLAAGKGCKKDLKKAAMYYRMAEAQGYDTVGLSWIHKDKYDPVVVGGKTKGGR